MAEDGVTGYDPGDADACLEIDRRDDVDTHCEPAGDAVVRELITQEGGGLPGTRTGAILGDVSLALPTIPDLERVGDRAVNTAARTLYVAENDDPLLH